MERGTPSWLATLVLGCKSRALLLEISGCTVQNRPIVHCSVFITAVAGVDCLFSSQINRLLGSVQVGCSCMHNLLVYIYRIFFGQSSTEHAVKNADARGHELLSCFSCPRCYHIA